MTITTKKDFLTLLKGATFLASGGGGPYSFAKSIVDHYFDDKTQFTLKIQNIEETSTASWTTIAAGMAQPSAGILLTPQAIIEPTVNAVKAMESLILQNYVNTDLRFKEFKKFDLLCPGEVGAMNITIPLISAYLLNDNLSIVDGDPSGRSVPTIDLGLFASNLPVMPNMATAGGDHYEFTVLSLKNYSDLGSAYSKLIEAGLIGIDTGLCMAPMSIWKLGQDNIVKGTLTDAFRIGEIFEQNLSAKDRINKIQTYLSTQAQTKRKMKTICKGIVIDYKTQTVDSTDLGYLTIKTDDDQGNYTILIQNENIIGQFDDKTSVDVTGPDSICYISTEDGILDENGIYENSLISQKLTNNEVVSIYVVAIEAASVVKENKKLMNSWNQAYKTSRYYGPYNANIWDN